jgi:hypothetical protein
MKALSLTQPWASLMALGHKHYETRSWWTSHRGTLAIQAAKGFPGWAQEFAAEELALGRLTSPLPRGAIVAIVRVVDVLRTEDAELEVSALERHLGDYSPGRYAWKTELLWALREPIACAGAQGIWTVPDAIFEQLRYQVQMDDGVFV